MSATRQSEIGVNAAANGIAEVLTGGGLEFMTGSPPALPESASSETVLARVDFSTFDPAVDGLLNHPFTGVAVQVAGTVGWWRCVDSAGDPVLDGPVYQTGDTPMTGGLELASVNFADGVMISGTFFYLVPKTE